jgi:glycosyltransferase involved in cell wall biosynthesis
VLNAIKTGLEKSRGKAVIVTMADSSDDPQTINQMIDKFNQGFDIVCGSRYAKGGKKMGGPVVKSILSKYAGVTAKYIMKLPTSDLTNSFKLYRKELLKKINIESQGGFELGMEILVKGYFLYGAKVTEVPTIWYDRTAGKSRFHLFGWLPSYLRWYFWGIRQRVKQIIGKFENYG